MEAIRHRTCSNPACKDRGKLEAGNIILHASFNTKSGARQRCLCRRRGRTFSANTRTAYFGLRCSRDAFDQVASMRVEGLSISAIARITGRSRSTVVRWLERAAASAKRFNDEHLRRFEIRELQADELCTFVGSKKNAAWLFTIIEVWSRLWPASVLGRRSYRNTEGIFNQLICRGRLADTILVTSDGFDYYQRVVRRLLGPTCVYGQVIKTRRNNRAIRVRRELKLGSNRQLATALFESEDSESLNTSFVERLNLTIRQGSAYLTRRSPCHARWAYRLREHVELLKSHYNFVRPHRGLKFGRVCRTPAMQAGLTDRPVSFREIFGAPGSSRPAAAILPFPRRPALTRSFPGQVRMAA